MKMKRVLFLPAMLFGFFQQDWITRKNMIFSESDRFTDFCFSVFLFYGREAAGRLFLRFSAAKRARLFFKGFSVAKRHK